MQAADNRPFKYPINQDWGLFNIDSVPIFMVRMMLQIRKTIEGTDYQKYLAAFKITVNHYVKKNYISVNDGKIVLVSDGNKHEIESQKKLTKDKVADAVGKKQEFKYWLQKALVIKTDSEEVKK